MNVRQTVQITFLATLCSMGALAADTPSASKVFDRQLTNTEREFVSLVEAMPADKFSFAPTNGEFKGVRTFSQQAMHAAAVLNEVASAMLGEKAPDMGKGENGPAGVSAKNQVVDYVKSAFALSHKAVATLTNENLMGEIGDPFNAKGKRTRVDCATMLLWHTFDHYGQMVEYARMNNVVPPASR
jgi:DinB superfamily